MSCEEENSVAVGPEISGRNVGTTRPDRIREVRHRVLQQRWSTATSREALRIDTGRVDGRCSGPFRHVSFATEREVVAMNTAETRKVLVGVDGSDASIEALKWAATLAEHLGIGVTAAVAWRNIPKVVHPATGTPERPPDDIEHQLDALLHEAADSAEIENLEYLTLRGPAADALEEASRRPDVALLVVGTRGLGPITGLMLGSVSRKLLFSVKRPLVVVPQAQGPKDFDHVVVGLDGSPVSEAVAAWTATLCSGLGAAATVVRCIDPGAEHSVERLDEMMTVSHLSFDKDHCAVFRGLDVPYEPVVTNGDARICLIETAIRNHAGLIIVGQHGSGQFAGLGGTASYLVRHSPLPLAIIPMASRLEASA